MYDWMTVSNMKIMSMSSRKFCLLYLTLVSSHVQFILGAKEDYCEPPPPLQHGIVKGEEVGDYFRSGDELLIWCEPGYTYTGRSQFVSCKDGKWDEEFGNCTETFCDPPEPLANGFITELESTNITSFPYLFQLTYVCNAGYRLHGDSSRFCNNNGWYGKAPYCEKIQCSDPGLPQYGMREGNSFEVGAKVRFKCFTGYNLLGSSERYCMSNGLWSGELTRCDVESNYCPDPGIPINGIKNSTAYDMGDKIEFRCLPGHIIIGSEIRECLSNRTWSGTEPKCLRPYDHDIYAKRGDALKRLFSQKAEEQKQKLKAYRESIFPQFPNGTRLPQGRSLNINYPGRLILYFVFDISGSVGERNFKKSIEFAKDIVEIVGISENGARAGALTFSSRANIEFLPVHFDTTESTLKRLDDILYTGGGTGLTPALEMLREECFPLTNAILGTKKMKSIVFILTDGKFNMGGNPKYEADHLKNSLVEIYSIGITGDVLQKSLYDIASEPKEEHVFIMDQYTTKHFLIQDIINGTIDYSQCGIGHEFDIVHKEGHDVSREATEPWPWMAAIYLLPSRTDGSSNVTFLCGGSIIHEQYILTNARCLHTKDASFRNDTEIYVKLGERNMQNETFVQEYEVEKVIPHPNFKENYPLYDYDIALLKLKKPISFTSYIRPICLPPAVLQPNTTLYKPLELSVETTWQISTAQNVKETGYLMERILMIQPKQMCINIVDGGLSSQKFTDRMLCTESTNFDPTCHRDVGGLLLQLELDSKGHKHWTQVGITSTGLEVLLRCHTYYTHVQTLRTWIDSNIHTTKK